MPSTGTSRRPSRRLSSSTSRRSATATRSFRATGPASRRCSRPAPSGRARSPRRRSAKSGSAWASALPARVRVMRAASLDLDLEVFQGPFDLLLTLVLREEVDLLEVDLAEVVLAYVEHLERSGELDLEAATEFLVLIAALLELKSRLMLPGAEDEGLEWEPQEAVEELLARLLEYSRYRRGAEVLATALAGEADWEQRAPFEAITVTAPTREGAP